MAADWVSKAPAAVRTTMVSGRFVRSVSGTDRESVVETLDQLLTLAPNFAPTLALHALACVRAWTTPRPGKVRDWETEARASVARALERAARVPESHHAAAAIAMQDGRFRDVARHERAALALAPTYPDAHLLLGHLKVEAGQSREGIEELLLAYDIEPALIGALHEQARWHGLYGDLATHDQITARIRAEPSEVFVMASLAVRVGAYRNEPDRIRAGLRGLVGNPHPIAVPLSNYARAMLKEIPPPPLAAVLAAGPTITSPRIRSIALQMTAETLGAAGDTEECARCVAVAASSILVDLDWMDLCPFLAEVRKLPEFAAWRTQVVVRCEAIWNG